MPRRWSWDIWCVNYEQLYCFYWGYERWATWLKGEVHISHGTAALLQKGEAIPICTLGVWNPVNFTIFNLNETGWDIGKKFGILISGEGTNPSTLLHFQLITITYESSSYQAFHSSYEEMQSEFPILVKTKNLFLSLVESVAQLWMWLPVMFVGEQIWETIGHGRQKS
jgi:hypothetical protein